MQNAADLAVFYQCEDFVCLFDLIRRSQSTIFSVMSGRALLGWTSAKQG